MFYNLKKEEKEGVNVPLEAGIRKGNPVKEARKARNSKRKPSHTICRMQAVTVRNTSTYAERLFHHLANFFIFSLEWTETSDIASSSISGVLLSLSLVGWG
jgi:hypothetical protein